MSPFKSAETPLATLCQSLPSLAVRMAPWSPTTHPGLFWVDASPPRQEKRGSSYRTSQSRPLFWLRYSVPSSEAAQMTSLAAEKTSSVAPVVMDRSIHVAPASKLTTTVPPVPEAEKRLPPRFTDTRSALVPLGAAVQESPPSVLRRMVPASPTATAYCPTSTTS